MNQPAGPARRDGHTKAQMESQNDQLASELHSKILNLKDYTIDFGNEIKEQNRLLEDMDGDFYSAHSLLNATMGKIDHMMRNGGTKHMCYLSLFALLVFFLIYLVLFRGV